MVSEFLTRQGEHIEAWCKIKVMKRFMQNKFINNMLS